MVPYTEGLPGRESFRLLHTFCVPRHTTMTLPKKTVDQWPLYDTMYDMLTVRLPRDIESALNRLARDENKSRSEVVKEALAHYFAQKENSRSSFELGADLFGQPTQSDGRLSTRYKSKMGAGLREKHSH